MDSTLGTRMPLGRTYLPVRRRRENWCEFRSHYVTEQQLPIFEVHDFRWRLRRPRYVCFACYMTYPKTGQYGPMEDDVPDTSEPCYTTGAIKFTRTTGEVRIKQGNVVVDSSGADFKVATSRSVRIEFLDL